jgi:hypothetical protein
MGTRVSGRKAVGLKANLILLASRSPFCPARNYELRLRLIFELHDNQLADYIGVVGILAYALDKFWWKEICQDVKDFCERCVVCRRAKIEPQMAATLNPLPSPPGPWHIVGID